MSLVASGLRAPAQPEFELDIAPREPVRPGLGRHLENLHEHGTRLRFHRNEAVFTAGEAAAQFYRVAAGCIRLCRHVGDGRRSVYDFMLPGDIFGLGGFRYFPYTAEAVGNATVVVYPAMAFEQLCENNAPLQADLMAHYMKSLADAQQHVFVTSCQTALERVASFIVAMSETCQLAYGDRIDLPMGRQDIADYLGLTVETICRSLASLKKSGMIAVPNAHQISVIDAGALRALAEVRHAQ